MNENQRRAKDAIIRGAFPGFPDAEAQALVLGGGHARVRDTEGDQREWRGLEKRVVVAGAGGGWR